jgi:plastocyanin
MTVRSISHAAAAALALSGVLAAAGCFSEREETTGPSTAECRTPGQPCVVEIRDYAFHPAEIHVAPGVTITWVNRDVEAHTSTSDDGSTWDSGLLFENETYERSFDQTGEFPYHCAPHPFMKGVVIVE